MVPRSSLMSHTAYANAITRNSIWWRERKNRMWLTDIGWDVGMPGITHGTRGCQSVSVRIDFSYVPLLLQIRPVCKVHLSYFVFEETTTVLQCIYIAREPYFSLQHAVMVQRSFVPPMFPRKYYSNRSYVQTRVLSAVHRHLSWIISSSQGQLGRSWLVQSPNPGGKILLEPWGGKKLIKVSD